METSSNGSSSQEERMHEEIKLRAYYFLEQKHTGTNSPNLDDELKGELPRIAYALSRVHECGDADASNDRAHRAARIYLGALSSFVARRLQSRHK